jgi:hypothetical protein
MVLTLWATTRFLFDEMRTTLELLTPMFAVYTTTVVKYFVSHRRVIRQSERPVSTPFVLLSFFFPNFFVLGLAGMIYLKSTGRVFADMEQFKTAIGIVGTSFAVYLGLVIDSLFEAQRPRSRAQDAR